MLIPLARTAVRRAVGVPTEADPTIPAWADEPGAAFVTLHLGGRLRGCIGSLSAYRPLVDDVRGNARAAALDDPRFRPVTPDEIDHVDLEVSVLSRPEPLTFSSEADLVAQLRPHVDGLLLEAPGHRGTYLPQVWEQLPDPADFLRSLKTKARLHQDWWGEDVRVSRYTVTAWEERAR
nr:AmmeMemoRadiSam system protein A [Arsenicicoccus dermatophilus]